VTNARALVEDFVEHLTPDGDIDAARAWRRIEREIQSPLRAREPGDEHPCQPFIDRVVIVVALAGHYDTMKQRSRAFH
jgi:hypothetical protein